MKKSFVLSLTVVIMFVLAVTSCAHKTEIIVDGYRFQWMASKGAYTATTGDASLLANFVNLSSSLTERVQRVSLLVEGKRFIAVVEGDMPQSLFKTGMLLSKDFGRKKGESWYSSPDGEYLIGQPQNNLVVVTNEDYPSAEQLVMDTFASKKIDDDTALLMASADVAVFSENPSELPSMPIFFGDFSASGIVRLLLTAKNQTLSLKMEFENQKLCGAFAKLMKLSYIARLKKAGLAVDLAALKKQFVEEVNVFSASGLIMSQEELDGIISSIKI